MTETENNGDFSKQTLMICPRSEVDSLSGQCNTCWQRRYECRHPEYVSWMLENGKSKGLIATEGDKAQYATTGEVNIDRYAHSI